MFQPKISVIVPVYNVEKYLCRCVDSIIKQSYKNLEIILVDDGSQDNCGNLCERYAEQDNRVIVIHKANGGLSSARNAGLAIANGEYISFVDSDDWLSTKLYNYCIENITRYDCDIIDFQVALTNGEEVYPKSFVTNSILVENKDILFDYLYRGQVEKCPFSVCRKLYRKELLYGIRFPECKANEDIATNFKILEKARKLIHINVIGYYYFQGNDSSITTGKLKLKDFDLLDASRELCQLAEKYDDRIRKLADIKLARSYFSLLAKAAVCGINKDIRREDLRYLTYMLRNNIVMLLKSPMPINRKILVVIVAIDYRILEYIINLYKSVSD